MELMSKWVNYGLIILTHGQFILNRKIQTIHIPWSQFLINFLVIHMNGQLIKLICEFLHDRQVLLQSLKSTKKGMCIVEGKRNSCIFFHLIPGLYFGFLFLVLSLYTWSHQIIAWPFKFVHANFMFFSSVIGFH